MPLSKWSTRLSSLKTYTQIWCHAAELGRLRRQEGGIVFAYVYVSPTKAKAKANAKAKAKAKAKVKVKVKVKVKAHWLLWAANEPTIRSLCCS